MRRSSLAAALVVVIAAACGGGASEPSADSPTVPTAPSATLDQADGGSELVGHTFDVRRDPG